MSGWLEAFAKPYTAALPATDTGGVISEVVEAWRPMLCDGNWYADYVRVRFSATKLQAVS